MWKETYRDRLMKVGWRPLELGIAVVATDRTRSSEKFGVAAHSKDRSRPLLFPCR